MEVPQLARVVGVVASFLHPKEEVVVVDSHVSNLGVASVGWSDVGDVVIVCSSTGPECGS